MGLAGAVKEIDRNNLEGFILLSVFLAYQLLLQFFFFEPLCNSIMMV